MHEMIHSHGFHHKHTGITAFLTDGVIHSSNIAHVGQVAVCIRNLKALGPMLEDWHRGVKTMRHTHVLR